jgi:hypothetical protein
VAIKLYYEEVLNPIERSTTKFQEHMEKAMELVRKEHYFVFCKHLPICDPTLGLDFFKEIQVHYDMNSKAKMFTKKLQMLEYSYVIPQKKLSWLKT